MDNDPEMNRLYVDEHLLTESTFETLKCSFFIFMLIVFLFSRLLRAGIVLGLYRISAPATPEIRLFFQIRLKSGSGQNFGRVSGFRRI